ncbi:hypothetical protein [Polaromonas vacuolata]|uniref:hypothetical protein n=1 Tax=Polaromonas vacuolata TaxID=37448 RepID=UPI0014570CB5|nr:hypothetical protein [Polaromonas vacuolata]
MDNTPRTLTMNFPSPYAREVSSAPDCKRFTGQDFNFKPAPIVGISQAGVEVLAKTCQELAKLIR